MNTSEIINLNDRRKELRVNQLKKQIVVKTLMSTYIFVGENQIHDLVESVVEEAFRNLKEVLREQVESDDLLMARKGCTRKVEALLIDKDNTVGCAVLAFESDISNDAIAKQLAETGSSVMGWKLYDLSLEALD